MDFRKIFILGMMALMAVGFSSCKEDEDEDYLSLDGAISLHVDPFIEVGTTLHLTASGISRDDGSFGWKWQVSPFMSAADTVRLETDDPALNDGSYDFLVPDSLCTATVSVSAFAEGYYTSYLSSTFTIVKRGESLQNTNFSAATGTFTDTRDGHEYPYVEIGDTQWFAENLVYAGAGRSFGDSPVMDYFYGRFYSWEDAQTSCPDGWHVPSESEWVKLAESIAPAGSYAERSTLKDVAGACLVDAYFNGDKLWEYWPDLKITNKTGLNMLPVGYSTLEVDGKYAYAGYTSYCATWTSDTIDANNAVYRYIYMKYPDIYADAGSRTGLSLPVRCVRSK